MPLCLSKKSMIEESSNEFMYLYGNLKELLESLVLVLLLLIRC